MLVVCGDCVDTAVDAAGPVCLQVAVRGRERTDADVVERPVRELRVVDAVRRPVQHSSVCENGDVAEGRACAAA